jgi:hypothetical protein
MKRSATNLALGIGLIILGLAIAAAGVYIGDADDAPGGMLIGILLMMAAVSFGASILQRKE